MSGHVTDAFCHAAELVGIEIWRFCQHDQFYFAERKGLSWFSCWKSHHENAEENSTAYERLSRAVHRFLHAWEYQNISYMLGWYLLRCFYSRIRNFCKKFWKRRERLFQKMFVRYENSTLIFENSSEKNLMKLHWQTRHVFNEILKIMWKHDKPIIIELHISKCSCNTQHSCGFIANKRM